MAHSPFIGGVYPGRLLFERGGALSLFTILGCPLRSFFKVGRVWKVPGNYPASPREGPLRYEGGDCEVPPVATAEWTQLPTQVGEVDRLSMTPSLNRFTTHLLYLLKCL